jgi:hypothetical protein
MRSLGLALVTAIAVVVLAGNDRPTSTNQSSDIEVPQQIPAWNGIYAATFPGCTASGTYIPARIVVVPRDSGTYGKARTLPYDEATVARINASWDNDTLGDDLFTIGKCAR